VLSVPRVQAALSYAVLDSAVTAVGVVRNRGALMRHRLIVFILVPLFGILTFLPSATAEGTGVTRPFKAADLKVEINATDGDAGLQIFLDDDAWRHITIINPAGRVMVDMSASGPLKDYGLTELFSESSEPPFDEFPLADFKRLFPEGNYLFLGQLIDGTLLRSEVPLTHDFPSGPVIVTPRAGTVQSGQPVVVRWLPVLTPPAVNVVGYQVLVVEEGTTTRTLCADLPRAARQLTVPPEFLQSGTEYKVEVLAIESSGNQTLTEKTFMVR